MEICTKGKKKGERKRSRSRGKNGSRMWTEGMQLGRDQGVRYTETFHIREKTTVEKKRGNTGPSVLDVTRRENSKNRTTRQKW